MSMHPLLPPEDQPSNLPPPAKARSPGQLFICVSLSSATLKYFRIAVFTKFMKIYIPVKKKLNHRGAARLLSAIAWSALTSEPHVFAITATSSYLGLQTAIPLASGLC